MTRAVPPVGVLGGTFDPVHQGHLALASTALRLLRLERVLLLPAAIPPHKAAPQLSAAHHREAMLRLAIEGRTGLALNTTELYTGRVCYTIDTLRRLSRSTPPCVPVFLMGTDSLLEIHTWRDYPALLREFDLAVFDRPGSALADAHGRLDRRISRTLISVEAPGSDRDGSRVPPLGRGGRIFHLAMEPVPCSSSEIRRLAAAGRSLEGLVPVAVARYIRANRLYRQEDPN